MNPKLKFSSPSIAALTIFAAAVLFTSWQAVAQSPPSKTATTWQDLGFNQLPDAFSTNEIPLFEGLNESRGTGSFERETTDGEAATPLKGSLQIMGNPKSGMLPVWKMVWGWPADDPEYAIIDTIMASPRFETAAEIADRRIKPCLPPQATEISLLSERGGHFARYKVAEADFMEFLDQLWEAKKDSSAHKRDRMSGEGERADRERMAQRFKAAEWEPLDNAITYFSPSKPSGAMTTYYYDREAGIAYHDTGYW